MAKCITPWTRKEEQLAVRLRAEGCRIASVAVALGRTYGQVSVKLSRLGATVPVPNRRSVKVLGQAVRRAVARGHTDREVAVVLGMTHQEVWKVRTRLGLAPGRGKLPTERKVSECLCCGLVAGSAVARRKGWFQAKARFGTRVARCPACLREFGAPTAAELGAGVSRPEGV